MVGSVLMDRMRAENDFDHVDPVFFSTSQVGQDGPDVGGGSAPLADAADIETLSQMDAIVTCQGGGYTSDVHGKLRDSGWRGYWIDAASTLRMADGSMIVLDPVNGDAIGRGIDAGTRDFIGGNCTVSLMLMALGGLFQHDVVEWITTMTYQAASGGGAANMRELISQMETIAAETRSLRQSAGVSILDIDSAVTETMRGGAMPTDIFGHPLAGSLLPWIDVAVDDGQSREEWKGFVETNKILGRSDSPIPIDGTCVRIGAMRCHSQAITIRLRRDVPMDEIHDMIGGANDWVAVVPNDKDATLERLTPTAVTGTLDVPVGRLRKMNLGPRYLNAFTVGDQLLWGAAEPLRRVLRMVVDHA